MTFSVDVKNESVVQALTSIAARLNDLSPPMRDIGQGLERSIRMRFAAQSDPDGTKWHTLAPSTVLNRAKTGARGGILEHFGTMLESLSFQADSNSVRVGFGVDVAVFHEFGTKKMPQRKMMFSDPATGQLGKDDEALVLDLLGKYLAV